MASSNDGKFIFLAVGDRIDVHIVPDFSSKNPPDPSSLFPFNPHLTLRPSHQQLTKLSSRSPQEGDDSLLFRFNHIRSGFIGNQESLVAVGEFGGIFVWNISDLQASTAELLETDDFSSTWGIAMSPNNNLLAVSSNSHAITIFDYTRKVILLSHTHQKDENGDLFHNHNIPSIDFSPCGRFLASCSIDGSIIIWSLIDGKLSKFSKSNSNEWGWLVRFVPTQVYDPLPARRLQFRKSFYNSLVEERPDESSDEDGSQSQFYLSFTEVDEEEELVEENQVGNFDEMMEEMINEEVSDLIYNDDDNDDNNDISSDYNSISPANNFNFQFSVLNPNVHLAEGVEGDSWPTDDEAEESMIEEENYFSDYSDRKSDVSSDVSSDPNDNDDDDDTICDSHCAFKLEIYDLKEAKIDQNLFITPKSVSFQSYDLFFCTINSIYVLDGTGLEKGSLKRVSQVCLNRQRQRDYFDSPFFIRNCLGMGEWIDKLACFLVVDSTGNFFISSPKTKDFNAVDLGTTLMLPDRICFDPRNEIVGYALITKLDEEFGWKVYIYLMHSNGRLKIYEITKRILDI